MDRSAHLDVDRLHFQVDQPTMQSVPLKQAKASGFAWLWQFKSPNTNLDLASHIAQCGAIALGKRPPKKSAIPLAEYLSNHFVECLVGDSDLLYDARLRRLQWRTSNGEVVATEFSTKHRIAVKVEAPRRNGKGNKKVDKVVPNDEIHKYRMEAREEEILAVSKSTTKKELKAAKRAMSLTYHPDSYAAFGDLAQEILKRRMQEINSAYDYVESRKQA